MTVIGTVVDVVGAEIPGQQLQEKPGFVGRASAGIKKCTVRRRRLQPVHYEVHRLIPREPPAAVFELVFPEVLGFVAIGIDKAFELLIGHFVTIDEKVAGPLSGEMLEQMFAPQATDAIADGSERQT